MKKKFNHICIVTGSRADFGLLKNVIDELKMRKTWNFDVLKIRKSATALVRQADYKKLSELEIKSIFEEENQVSSSAEEVSTDLSKAISISLSTFQTLAPDFILVLGDRHEILGSVISANLIGIPVAHISGGEITHGSYDDSFRHAISKMASIHFVKEVEHKKRLMRLGENPKFIFQVGNLANDSISRLNPKSRLELEKELDVAFGEKNIMVVMHPETRGTRENEGIRELLKALDEFPDITIFFTAPGNDVGAREIDYEIRQYTKKRDNVFYFVSLGQHLYLSLLANCVGIVGNSSSALFEAPLLGLGSVNIGLRQSGRVISENVINCSPNHFDIARGIKLLFEKVDTQTLGSQPSFLLLNGESVSKKIIDGLESVDVNDILIKEFYDVSS